MENKIKPAAKKRSLVLSRMINAPREVVFQAWIDPEQVKVWWGPHGFTNPVCELDARPGGAMRICMDSPEFPNHWMSGEFREIIKGERLVFVAKAFVNEAGYGIETLNTITFEEHQGKTKLSIHVEVMKVDPKFQVAVDHMDDGWSQSLDRLTDVAEGYKTKDRELVISRLLNAPRELVFKVWTDPDHIKNWWGPNGFTNTIHKMEVKKGGEWDFVMHGPDGTDYKNKSIFREIVKPERIVYEHVSGPKFLATVNFTEVGAKTLIRWSMLFESEASFLQTVKTFKADEGLKQNIDKLDHYVSTQLKMRNQLKNTTMSRVTTYLNFPGNTEEAFKFYKTVFGTEFGGDGIQRFGDITPPEGMPPLSEEDKKLIIHVELPILGGHILMATDATASMGLKVVYGNNMHINLEPDTREETKRLFDALSAGGKVTMDLQDMFWGAYFGSCIDKFGINWMFNCTEKK